MLRLWWLRWMSWALVTVPTQVHVLLSAQNKYLWLTSLASTASSSALSSKTNPLRETVIEHRLSLYIIRGVLQHASYYFLAFTLYALHSTPYAFYSSLITHSLYLKLRFPSLVLLLYLPYNIPRRNQGRTKELQNRKKYFY